MKNSDSRIALLVRDCFAFADTSETRQAPFRSFFSSLIYHMIVFFYYKYRALRRIFYYLPTMCCLPARGYRRSIASMSYLLDMALPRFRLFESSTTAWTSFERRKHSACRSVHAKVDAFKRRDRSDTPFRARPRSAAPFIPDLR